MFLFDISIILLYVIIYCLVVFVLVVTVFNYGIVTIKNCLEEFIKLLAVIGECGEIIEQAKRESKK